MALLSQESADGSIFFFSFDATVQEGHSAAVDITDHAVEEGANITDHVRPQPLRIALTVRISNTPVTMYGNASNPLWSFREKGIELFPADGVFGQEELTYDSNGVRIFANVSINTGKKKQTVTVLRFDDPINRVQEIHAELLRMAFTGELNRVSSSLRDYEDMLIESVDAPRDAASGDSVLITVNLKQIRIVSSEDVPLPEQPRGASKKNKGSQSTDAATTAVQTKSRTSILSDTVNLF